MVRGPAGSPGSYSRLAECILYSSPSMSLGILSSSGPVPCLLDNAPYATSSHFTVIDPNDPDRAPLHDVHGANVAEAVKAIESAAAAFPTWRETSYNRRREIFLRAAEIMKQRRDEFIAISVRETTAPSGMAAFDCSLALAQFEELAGALSEALRSNIPPPSDPDSICYIKPEPFGVVLAIPPWNGPLCLSCRAVATPIIAGNTVVLKTSEYSPKTNSIIAQVLVDAGLPPGVLNVIHVSAENAPKVTEAIIAHPAVRKVNFTGSTRVGSIIGGLCGRYIKPVVLELGGAAHLIVLPDADIKHAVQNAVYGGLYYSGQLCMSTNNVLVHESIADAFISILQQETKDIRAGHQVDEKHQLRGLYDHASAKRIADLVDDGIARGAKLIVGNHDIQQNIKGSVVQPIVLDHVVRGMRVADEEIFGPVLGITRFRTDEEAIQIANSSQYGLASAIHSRDISRALKIAQKLDAAGVHINSFTLRTHANHPYGGSKASGFGRFNGLEGIREFTQSKVITVTNIGVTPNL